MVAVGDGMRGEGVAVGTAQTPGCALKQLLLISDVTFF